MATLRNFLVTVRTPVATVHRLVPALSVADARARAASLGADVRVHTSEMEAQPAGDEKVQAGDVAYQTRKMTARENFFAAILLPVAAGFVLVPIAAWINRWAGAVMLVIALAAIAYFGRAALPGLLFARFRAALREERFSDAERELSWVTRLSRNVTHPLFADMLTYMRAKLAAARGDRELALATLDRITTRDERQSLDYRGSVSMTLRDRDTAIEAYRRAAELGSTAAAIELAWQAAVAREPAPSVPVPEWDALTEMERGWIAMTEALRGIDEGRREWAATRVAEARAQLEATLLVEESAGVLAFCDGVAALARGPGPERDRLVDGSRRWLEKSVAGRALLARLERREEADNPERAVGDAPAAALQFDHAEVEGPSETPCAACRKPLADTYYEINAKLVCPSCHAALLASVPEGSGTSRFFYALGLGIVAAGVGSGIYFAVSRITGYEIGLVGIVVGFLVGAAVKRGSGGRGGRGYQVLAVVLTYFAIVTTYVPHVVKGIREASKAAPAASSSSSPPGAHPLDRAEPAPGTPAEPAASAAPAVSAPVEPAALAPDAPKTFGAFGLALALVVIFAIACAAPFLAGAQNIMGLLIIGFSLYQAWKMNAKVAIRITGPHRMG